MATVDFDSIHRHNAIGGPCVIEMHNGKKKKKKNPRVYDQN